MVMADQDVVHYLNSTKYLDWLIMEDCTNSHEEITMDVNELIAFFRDEKNLRRPTTEQLNRENYETGLYAWYSDLRLVQESEIAIPQDPGILAIISCYMLG